MLTTWRDVKDELVAVSGITGWRFHDMRRSFASALGEAGIPEAVADAVPNHRQSATRGGVLGVYQRAERWPEQMAAMQRWGELLAAAIDGRARSCEVTNPTSTISCERQASMPCASVSKRPTPTCSIGSPNASA
jgi:hypothetical protein